MHTSSSFSMIFLIMLAWAFDFKKSIKIMLIVVALIIMICVPISRVVMGYHYMTDILFSLIASMLVFLLSLMLVDRIYFKKREMNKAE